MPVPTKVFVALDFASKEKASALVDQLLPLNPYFKIGLEMFTAFGPSYVSELSKQGAKLFLDLKFHDIPNTVAKSIEQVTGLGAEVTNIHISGGKAMVLEAVAAKNRVNKNIKLLGVTVLTSLGLDDLKSVGISVTDVKEQTLMLAKWGKNWGLDGVVCSAFDVAQIKAQCGAGFLAVTPGIRMQNDSANDQKRVATPEFAKAQGADYLVVGRPITQAENPREALSNILATL